MTLTSCKRIMRYLKTTSDATLRYCKWSEDDLMKERRSFFDEMRERRGVPLWETDREALALYAYGDASFAPAASLRVADTVGAELRSITGTAIRLGRPGQGLLLWSSKRQPMATASTAESELVAQLALAQQAEGVSLLLAEIGLRTQTVLHCDNCATLAQMSGTTTHKCRHMAVRAAVLRDLLAARSADAEYVPSANQVADVLTKCLGRLKHRIACQQLGLWTSAFERDDVDDDEVTMMMLDMRQELIKAAVTVVTHAVDTYVNGADGRAMMTRGGHDDVATSLTATETNCDNGWSQLVAAACTGGFVVHALHRLRALWNRPRPITTVSRGNQSQCTYEWDHTQLERPGRFKYLGHIAVNSLQDQGTPNVPQTMGCCRRRRQHDD